MYDKLIPAEISIEKTVHQMELPLISVKPEEVCPAFACKIKTEPKDTVCTIICIGANVTDSPGSKRRAPDLTSFKCGLCEKFFSQNDELQLHLEFNHK
ncbi:hypothetical protein ACTXT7_014489, partial [Hymenolepis weldensis]